MDPVDLSNDYSFVLRTIEGRIGDVAQASLPVKSSSSIVNLQETKDYIPVESPIPSSNLLGTALSTIQGHHQTDLSCVEEATFGPTMDFGTAAYTEFAPGTNQFGFLRQQQIATKSENEPMKMTHTDRMSMNSGAQRVTIDKSDSSPPKKSTRTVEPTIAHLSRPLFPNDEDESLHFSNLLSSSTAASMAAAQNKGIINSTPSKNGINSSLRPVMSPQGHLEALTAAACANGKMLRLQVALDEERLCSERLREELRSSREELDWFREQSVRQLKHLEETTSRLRREADTRLASHFEEKKKWTARLRELEHSNATIVPKSAAQDVDLNTSLSSYRSQIRVLTDQIAEWQQRYQKSQSDCAEQERIVRETHQEKLVLQQQLDAALDSAASTDLQAELSALRRQYSEAETNMRRQAREIQRHQERLKNQSMLEESLAAAQSRATVAEDTIARYQTMEGDHRRLTEEKRALTQIFSKILYESLSDVQEVDSLRDKDATPARLVTVLSAIQQRCLELQAVATEREVTIASLKELSSQHNSAMRAAEERIHTLLHQLETLQARSGVAHQETKMYHAELESLRAMVASYDEELRVSAPDVQKLLTTKDEAIKTLRRELDSLRREYEALVSQVKQDESTSTAQSENGTESTKQLSEALEALRTEYAMLQEFTGVDFLPCKTKVLRFTQNPTIPTGSPALCSIPREVIPRLIATNKALREQLAVANASIANAATNSIPTAVTSPGTVDDAHSDNSRNSKGAVDPNKLNQRLKAMFQERIATYREVVYLLTGYKMELLTEKMDGMPVMRLRSQYAEQESDSLLFRINGTDAELLETPFANSLDDTLLTPLIAQNSPPAFLAGLTIHLFDSQTMAMPRFN